MAWWRLIGLPRLGPEEFARRFIALGLEMGVLKAPELRPRRLTIIDGTLTLHLSSAYAQFIRLPRRKRISFLRETLITFGRAATHSVALPSYFAGEGGAQTKVLPRMRPRAWLELNQLAAEVDGHPFRFASSKAEILPGLFSTMVIDQDDQVIGINDDAISGWSVAYPEIQREAEKNLLQRSGERFASVAPGVWLSPWAQDACASARMLLPHILHQVISNPIVAIPNRDTLLVCHPRSSESLGHLVEILTRLSEVESYRITRRLLKLDGEVLRWFDFPAVHPARELYDRLLYLEAHGWYNEQAELLRELIGPSPKIAELLARERAGRFETFAEWSRDQPTLLPRADFIRLKLGRDRTFDVAFETLLEWPGALETTRYFPERWRTGAFPTPDRLRDTSGVF